MGNPSDNPAMGEPQASGVPVLVLSPDKWGGSLVLRLLHFTYCIIYCIFLLLGISVC